MRKDLPKLNFSLLTTIQLISFYAFLQIVPNNQKLFIAIFIVVLVFASYFWTLLKSFTLLVAGALLSSFYSFWIAWNQGSLYQLQIITQQSVSMLFATLSWGLAVYVKSYIDKNESLRDRVSELEKYAPELGVLTMNEFLERARLLFTAMKRRNENAVGIKITFKEFQQGTSSRKASKGLMKIISQAVISSVRKEFDIVGYLSSNQLMLLLQNTDRAGAEIVIARIKERLSANPDLNFKSAIEDIEFEIRPLGSNFEALREYLGLEFSSKEGQLA